MHMLGLGHSYRYTERLTWPTYTPPSPSLILYALSSSAHCGFKSLCALRFDWLEKYGKKSQLLRSCYKFQWGSGRRGRGGSRQGRGSLLLLLLRSWSSCCHCRSSSFDFCRKSFKIRAEREREREGEEETPKCCCSRWEHKFDTLSKVIVIASERPMWRMRNARKNKGK